jgi:hypothetical protein
MAPRTTALAALVAVTLAVGVGEAQPRRPAGRPAAAAPAAPPPAAPPRPAPPPPDADADEPPVAARVAPAAPASFHADAMELVTTSAAGPVELSTAPLEVFPLAARVWLRTLDLGEDETNAIDAARAGKPGSWFCAPTSGPGCSVTARLAPGMGVHRELLTAMRVRVPALPVPVTVYTRQEGVVYNPKLIGRIVGSPGRYHTRAPLGLSPAAATPPPAADAPAGASPAAAPAPSAPPKPDAPAAPKPEGAGPVRPSIPSPFEGELQLLFHWPTPVELGDFQYVAVVDACDNAIVTRYTRDFAVPAQVEEVETCSAGTTAGPLRIFKSGGSLRVTAFNLQRPPSRGNVMSVTYRVEVPGVETPTRGERTSIPVLVPDLPRDSLRVDCGPPRAKPAPTTERGPGPAPAPPSSHLPGHALAGESFVIAPEPLRTGRCRILVESPSTRRLVAAPVRLFVTIERMDVPADDKGRELLKQAWLLAPGALDLQLPAIPVDGEARLRLTVYSDPASAAASGIFFTDALSRPPQVAGDDHSAPFRRSLASATIMTAPLCGGWDFRTVEETGSCARAYVTFPVMLASLQLTRAPWVEKPIAEPSVPGAIAVALAIDSYDPAKQRAFPLAFQLGGAYQPRLTSAKSGILGYAGVAASLPVLGSGGLTTTVGLVGGLGLVYIIDDHGPNEGAKPTAFLSIAVSPGQLVLKTGGPAGPLPP